MENCVTMPMLAAMERRMDEFESALGIGPETPSNYSLDVGDIQLKMRELSPLVAKLPIEQIRGLLAMLEKPQLTDDELAAEIEHYKPLIRKWAEQLEAIERLKKHALDSDAIAKLPALRPRIEAAKKDVDVAGEMVERHSIEVEELRAVYQAVFDGICDQIVRCEAALDAAEAAAAKSKK